ncbi:AP2/ERF domain-containing protein PFD0985w-like [Teleopsis dalmanni]|uniref:AP2/ERF domain-containing protein PFD0985w-like n=1 Tax=Teleopsis dalmanni TaxID=139649 RepID=UPI0018CD7133|nr:AP2/ERF domain-containing protein PFD0985w-like [Teleopsis dalmanni]
METLKDEKLKDVDIGEQPIPTTVPPPEPAPTVKNEVRKLMRSGRRVARVRTSIITDRAAIVRARLRAKLLRKKTVKTSDGSKPSSRYHFRQKYSEIPKLIVQKYEMYKQLKDLKSYLVQVHSNAPKRKVKFQTVKTEEKVRLRLEFENWMGHKHGMPKIEPISEDESEPEKVLYTSEIKVKKEEFNTKQNEKIKQDYKEIPFDMQQQQNNEVSNNNDTYHFTSQLPTIKEETLELMDMQEPIFEEVVEDGVVVEENGNYSQHLAPTHRSAIYVPNFRLVPLAETPFATQNAHNRVYATLEEFFADRIRLYSPLIEICLATMGQEEFDAFLWYAFVPPASLLPANTVPTVHLYWNPPNDNVNAHFFGCEHGYNHIDNAEITDDEIVNNEDVGVVSTDGNEDNIDIENFDDDEGNVNIGDSVSDNDKKKVDMENSDNDKENVDFENSDDEKENIDMENSDDDKENVDIESSDDDNENINIENSDAENENVTNEYTLNAANVEKENIRNEDMENEYVENEHFENAGIDRPQGNFNRYNGDNNFINDLYRINIRGHEIQPPSGRYHNNLFDPYAPPEWFNGIGYPEHVLASYHPFGFEERIYIGSQIINEEFNAYIRYVSRNN